MRHLAWATLLLLSAARAAAPGPDDFATGFVLGTTPGAALHRLRLDDAVLRESRVPELADLAVFNGLGEPVPFALVVPAAASAPARELAANLFPVAAVAGGEGHAYLVDLGATVANTTGIDVRWPASAVPFVVPIQVEFAETLDNWRILQARSTLAELLYAGRRLRQDALHWAPRRLRYLRLRPAGDRPLPPLDGVTVRAAATTTETGRDWAAVTGRVDEEAPGSYLFDLGAYRPVDRLRLGFPQRNTLATVTLESRRDDDDPWRRRYQGQVYALELDGVAVTSDPIVLPSAWDRHWRLIVDDAGGGLGTGLPVLHAGWRVPELRFVTRGEPPFTLAVGSLRASASTSSALPGIAGIEPEAARRLARKVLGGDSALVPPVAPLPLRRIALWTVLLLAVATLAWMARGLLRDLRR